MKICMVCVAIDDFHKRKRFFVLFKKRKLVFLFIFGITQNSVCVLNFFFIIEFCASYNIADMRQKQMAILMIFL